MIKKYLLICITISLTVLSYAQINNSFNLMPLPVSLKVNGNPVRITPDFRVSVIGNTNARFYFQASRFIRRLSNKTGIFLDRQGYVTKKDSSLSAALIIRIHRPGRLTVDEDERYSLVTDANHIEIVCNDRSRCNTWFGNAFATCQFRCKRILYSRCKYSG